MSGAETFQLVKCWIIVELPMKRAFTHRHTEVGGGGEKERETLRMQEVVLGHILEA